MTLTQELSSWWVEHYRTHRSPALMYDVWKQPFREFIIEGLKVLSPVKALYEIGCGAGPNLRLIRERLPEIKLGGSDISPELSWYAGDKLGIKIDVAELPHQLPGPEWDCVLSCYAMAYLTPDEVEIILRKIRSRSILIAEPHTEEYALLFVPRGGPPEWHMNYPKMLRDAGWRDILSQPVHSDGNLNCVTIASRG